ncbi:MAG: type II toxin-antitoxin system VapC family toxin [Nitrososphaeria archaeon]|nr:type II toxin-antitoxin system VapC family toxin [Nitrososphaeria archaeon]
MSKRKIEGIIDASTFYPLLKKVGKSAASLLTRLAILDLTKYELGNVIWKEHMLGLIDDWKNCIENWSKIIEEMQTYSIKIQHLKYVENIAIERNLTFYDASYIYVSEANNLKLITLDEDMLNKCKNSISLDKFLIEHP